MTDVGAMGELVSHDPTVAEFWVQLPSGPIYTRPLAPGHRFHFGDEKYGVVVGADGIMEVARKAAAKALGVELKPATEWWVVTLDGPRDPDLPDPETGLPMALGDHNEGTSLDQWTILLAVNDLPPGAGGDFRLVDGRDGNIVGKPYPHTKGRGVAFRSRHFHGNEQLTIKCDRVSLAQIVEPA